MISVEDLSFSYNRRHKVVENVSFTANKGECFAILGNNGAGKSTLLKCINGILKASAGKVMLNGDNLLDMSIADVARQVAYVQQDTSGGNLCVYDTLMLGRKPYIKWQPVNEDRDIVNNVIEQLNLNKFANRKVGQLSGGERQRVTIGRALVQQPQVLLLDEPTSNLDLGQQHYVLDLVREISQNLNICVIMVQHDLNLAMKYCDRFLFLKEGIVYKQGGKEVMTPEIISNVYKVPVSLCNYNERTIIVA